MHALPLSGSQFREDWQIELFFKALKQTAKVKSFLGTSANAPSTFQGKRNQGSWDFTVSIQKKRPRLHALGSIDIYGSQLQTMEVPSYFETVKKPENRIVTAMTDQIPIKEQVVGAH